MNPESKGSNGPLQLRGGLVASCFVILLAAGWTEIQAAELPKTPPQAGETTPAPPVPVAIAASEIIPRAEQTLKALQETRFEIAAESAAVLNSIQRDITAFAERSDRRWQAESENIAEVRSVQRLNDILREWSLEQSQLDSWDRVLSRRSQSLVGQEKDISQILDTWQATRATGKQQALPDIALQRIAEVLREADAVRGVIHADMEKLLHLQNQLATRRDFLSKIRNELDRAREKSGRGLFVLDSLPLWEALFNRESRDVVIVQVVQSSLRFVEDSQEFINKYRVRLLWHAVLLLAMVLLLRFLRGSLTPQAVEKLGGSSANFVLDRPLASSFLLALTALPLLYPGAPAAVLRIAFLPSVIPAIRLLPGLLPRIYRRWLYMLVALYVLDFLRYLLPAAGLLTRLLLLLIALGGCAGLGLFLRLRGAELSGQRSRERLVLVALQLVLFLFGVSVVSNFAGNLALAEILVAAPIRITYAAALIFAGAHLLMTLAVVALQSPRASWFRSVQAHGELIAFRCSAFIRFAAILFWVVFSLYVVGVAGDISAAGADFLQLRWKVGAAEISIQDVAAFIAVILGSFVFSRLIRFVLSEEILPRIRLPRGVPGAVDVLARYGILLLGFFIALAAAGVDLSKVTLLVSAVGVGIGFGLQSVVNNFVSGLILVFEHPLQVGDSIEVGTIFGEVRKIGFRASVIRTPDGADVVIPNGELVGTKFINWSLSDRLRRISITVGVAYGTDAGRVIDILVGIARNHRHVLVNPAPLAVFDRFGDSALNFTLLCWAFLDNFFLTRSELTIAIDTAFKEAGIEIPFPQQDVHVHWPDGGGAFSNQFHEMNELKSDKDRAFVSVQEPLVKK